MHLLIVKADGYHSALKNWIITSFKLSLPRVKIHLLKFVLQDTPLYMSLRRRSSPFQRPTDKCYMHKYLHFINRPAT